MPDQFNSKTNSTQGDKPLSIIGAFLKGEREKQNLSKKELASSLRIGEEQLTALEDGDEHLLPELVFIKAMIRRVSERLHVDPKPLIKRLEASHKGQGIEQQDEGINLHKNQVLIINHLGKITKRKWTYILPGGVIAIAFIAFNLITFPITSTNKIQSDSSIAKVNDITENKSIEEIVIRSIKPSKVTIIDNKGKILFKGTLRKSLKYNLSQGLDIFAKRPDLIEISSENDFTKKLGKKNDVRWRTLTKENVLQNL